MKKPLNNSEEFITYRFMFFVFEARRQHDFFDKKIKTLRSIGIAASLSAGLRENFGTMTKPLHAGRAAESGVIACDLTDYGWSSTDKILESPRGFFQAHGGGYDIKAIKV